MHFKQQGRCIANLQGGRLDLDAPNELMNLDAFHKTSLSKTVERMNPGRFTTAPRDFFASEAVKRSNSSQAGRLFLDPYHVSDGNLWAPNYEQTRFQRGGTTSHAARSKNLIFEKEPPKHFDPQRRQRSKFLEPPTGRFVGQRKPVCARDKGPDPYGTAKHLDWTIPDHGYFSVKNALTDTLRASTQSAPTPAWNTYSVSRRAHPL